MSLAVCNPMVNHRHQHAPLYQHDQKCHCTKQGRFRGLAVGQIYISI